MSISVVLSLVIQTIVKCEVSQGSVATSLARGGKYYMRFVGNLFSFPLVKEV